MFLQEIDIAVIGGGPAGMLACIQLKRQGLEPVLFEKDRLGGMLWNANIIENYPGFKSIKGKELAKRMVGQFKACSVPVKKEEVKEISGKYDLKTNKGEYHAKKVIVATGTKPKKLDVKNEQELYEKKKLFYEIKDLETTNKHYAIIGSGDAAFDYALNLASQGNKATIFHKEIKCLKLLEERARENKKIKLENQKVKNIKEENQLAINNVYADYVIVATGKEANLDMLKTKAPVIGDAANKWQLVIALGSAMKTAMEINDESY